MTRKDFSQIALDVVRKATCEDSQQHQDDACDGSPYDRLPLEHGRYRGDGGDERLGLRQKGLHWGVHQ